jgi:hypothetical protein
MILRRRTVELLARNQLPMSMRDTVDHVLVLGGLPCTTIATRTSQPVVMTVGLDRASALRRLAARLACGPHGDASTESLPHKPPD